MNINIINVVNMSKKLKYPTDSEGYAICVDFDNIKNYMDLYNFVVIQALTHEECIESVRQGWIEMNNHGNGKLDPNDPTTWINDNWPLPDYIYLSNHPTMTEQSLKNMVNPNIVKTFEILFGHSQICPDVGIISIKRPVIVNGEYLNQYELNPLRLHYDRDTPEIYSKYNPRYQGCLALVDCGHDVGSISCVPGSANEVKKNPTLWTNVNQGKYIMTGKESGFLHANVQKIPLREGCMIIWAVY